MGKLLKIVRIGDEVGVVFPPEVLAELQARPGDEVWVEKTDASPAAGDAELERQLAIGRGVMRDYERALRDLAK